MRKSSKKVVVAVLLVTLLSQTLYSAAAGIFGLSAQSYAYADDEYTDTVEPAEAVDESTQDDSDRVQKAPDESRGEEAAAPEDELIDESTEVVDEDKKDIEGDTKEAVDIRLRASYVDKATGSSLKDTEDLNIETNFMYIPEYEAPEIKDYTYDKTTI